MEPFSVSVAGKAAAGISNSSCFAELLLAVALAGSLGPEGPRGKGDSNLEGLLRWA